MPCTQCEEKPYCNRAAALQLMAGSAVFPSGCLDEGQGLVFLHRLPYSSDLGKCKGRCTLAIFGPFPPAVGWPGHGGGWWLRRLSLSPSCSIGAAPNTCFLSSWRLRCNQEGAERRRERVWEGKARNGPESGISGLCTKNHVC